MVFSRSVVWVVTIFFCLVLVVGRGCGGTDAVVLYSGVVEREKVGRCGKEVERIEGKIRRREGRRIGRKGVA